MKLFYFFLYVIVPTSNITSLSSWVVKVADCRFKGCRFKYSQNFYVTLRCLTVESSVGPIEIYNGLWLSGLGCLLLLQNYWPMLLVVGSTPTNGSFPHLYPVYKKQKNFPPLSPIMCFGSCSHHGKKCCTTKDDQALWLWIDNTLCHHPTHDPALNKSFKMHKSETNNSRDFSTLRGYR